MQYVKGMTNETKSKFNMYYEKPKEFGKMNFSAFDFSEFQAIAVTDSRFNENQKKYFTPSSSNTYSLITYMNRQFQKNVNPILFNMSNRKLGDIMKSCVFGFEKDCNKESSFDEVHGTHSCFTFNSQGTKSMHSEHSGLEMVFAKKESEPEYSVDGSNAFTVQVHHPDQEPSMFRDKIPFETGYATTIRVERSVMTRENITQNPCIDTVGYSRDACIRECVIRECVKKFKHCDLFFPQASDTDKYQFLNVFEMNMCYIAALFTRGSDVNNNGFLKVNTGQIQGYSSRAWVGRGSDR